MSEQSKQLKEWRVRWSDEEVFVYKARTRAEAERMARPDRIVPRISEVVVK